MILAKGYEAGKDLKREITQFSNRRMASYKWISVLEFVDEMPKTISGKIRRVELRKSRDF